MTKEVLLALKSYTTDTDTVNKFIVSLFLDLNGLIVDGSSFLCRYSIENNSQSNSDTQVYLKIKELFCESALKFDFEVLIELFEFVISPAHKIVNGAVYTPLYIREFIVESVLSGLAKSETDLSAATFGDISCGCGGFLFTLAKRLKVITKRTYKELLSEQIFGLDIEQYSCNRTKILLALLALSEGEHIKEQDLNIYSGDALSFNWKSKDKKINRTKGFTGIVGNPPYVVSKHIDLNVKKNLSQWQVTQSGRPDLYIPFFEIGMAYLQKGGILGLITMNTFLKSLNGRALRNYFVRNSFDFSIIDFGWHQVFKKRLTYTCICIISNLKSKNVRYTKVHPDEIRYLEAIPEDHYNIVPYTKLKKDKIWQFIDRDFISKVEQIGIPLGKSFEIRNGFATLNNNVYLFKPEREDDKYYYFIRDRKETQVEKEVCREAIKPNILQCERDIEKLKEQMIFPYILTREIKDTQSSLFGEKKAKSVIKIIEEKVFKEKYPYAYRYLKGFKEELGMRDKGKGKYYEEWYAYGRKQALNNHGYKLLFPYLAKKPRFIFCDNKDLLYYNGFAILSDDKTKLLALQKILNSSIFEQYISLVSKPYSSNYFSLGKRYIKNFGIIPLNDESMSILLNGNSREDIEDYIKHLYLT